MLTLMGLLAGCTSFADLGNQDDTAMDTGVPEDQAFTVGTPGPFDQVCDVWNEEFDVQFGIDRLLFLHSAQALKAKLDKYMGATAPTLVQVCEQLGQEIQSGNSTANPPPPLDDCPGLLPQDISQLPPDLQDFYFMPDPANQILTWAEFRNIRVYQWTMTVAMDRVESQNDPSIPGCWLEYGLVGDAASGNFGPPNFSKPQIISNNSMPIVLYALETYGTAAVLYTDGPQTSMVFGGATFVMPGAVWQHVSQSPNGTQRPGYFENYLLAGYPPNASIVVRVNNVRYGVDGVYSTQAPYGTMPLGIGRGIIDPETEQQLREMDWIVTTWHDSTELQDTTDPSSTGFPGASTGFPTSWPN
ncbi:MAG: hypothetical protein ACI9VR_000890 [Cognaticolwellia sp.]|jgi:hypothetical protein